MDITKPSISEKKVPTVSTRLYPPGEVLTYDYVLRISVDEAEPELLLLATPEQLEFALDSILLKATGDVTTQVSLVYHSHSSTYRYEVKTSSDQKYTVLSVPTINGEELYRRLVEVLKLVTGLDYMNLNEI